MGKASKWIKNLFTGKKSSCQQAVSVETCEYPKTPISLPPGSSKDKRRWSFRKSSTFETYQKDVNVVVDTTADTREAFEDHYDQKRHAMTIAVANTVAAVAAAQVAMEDAMRLTCSVPAMPTSVGDIAATKIQSVFRSYLARKALFALKGLVKLQAMVRGHLVRRQATATVRCMQALLTVQARARVRRINMINEPNPYNQWQTMYTEPTIDERFTSPVHDPQTDHIKIVEMDTGHTKGSTKSRVSYFSNKQKDDIYSKHQHISPAPSAVTNMSPKSYSWRFDGRFQSATHSSPRHHPAMDKPDMSKVHFSYKKENGEDRSYEYQFFPNYMANTKSSKAKYRSHSAPKQRPADTYQHQPSKRRVSIEGRNVPRAVRMERSSSVYCSTHNYQYPWSLEFDETTPSIKNSECGSNSSMRTNYYYCRSLAGFKGH